MGTYAMVNNLKKKTLVSGIREGNLGFGQCPSASLNAQEYNKDLITDIELNFLVFILSKCLFCS